MGSDVVCTQVPVATRVNAETGKQALLPSEIASNQSEGLLEEKPLAMGPKMAAPITDRQDPIIVLSDTEDDDRTLYQAGQLIEFTDEGEVGMRGVLIGEADVNGSAGRA
ncbi:hypothetical protein NDU88_001907 [Pleurodeles waltl]|uniref:Uncharacterized protein n=1 Tax=Pleurodeles waltl TaxID=8319 RepID=A0AAV7W0V9_PLEWA|nr:hypothetical protein NDU88_001907 [Pleurodeles waltl]